MRGKISWPAPVSKLNDMQWIGKQAGLIKKTLAILLLTAVTAFGAGWDSVVRITEGQKIEVRMRDGAELKGTFISATSESIAIGYKSGEQSIERANVLRVRVHDSGHRTRQGVLLTAIGAGAGAGIGAAVCPQCSNEGGGAKYVGLGAAVGAGIGALGFLASPYKTVYKVK